MKIFCGCDIEDVNRFENCDSSFLNLVFTKKELDYCLSRKRSKQHLAARFCAKESIIKAFGSAGLENSFQNIEILNEENGAPKVILKNNIEELSISLSMSHCKNYATASVVVCKK